MSVAALQWAWKRSVDRSSAKLVLLALADMSAEDDYVAHPTLKRLRELTGLHRSTLIGILNSLKAAGHIVPVGRRPQHGAVIYRLPVGVT
jgi:pyocin large subunit-like protein